MNIDQSLIYYIPMDSSQHALHTNGKFFFLISKSFFDLSTLFKNNSGVGFRHARCGRPFR